MPHKRKSKFTRRVRGHEDTRESLQSLSASLESAATYGDTILRATDPSEEFTWKQKHAYNTKGYAYGRAKVAASYQAARRPGLTRTLGGVGYQPRRFVTNPGQKAVNYVQMRQEHKLALERAGAAAEKLKALNAEIRRVRQMPPKPPGPSRLTGNARSRRDARRGLPPLPAPLKLAATHGKIYRSLTVEPQAGTVVAYIVTLVIDLELDEAFSGIFRRMPSRSRTLIQNESDWGFTTTTVQYIWQLDARQLNKLMHMLNGNIEPAPAVYCLTVVVPAVPSVHAVALACMLMLIRPQVAYLWGVASGVWNRLMHSLNGNQDRDPSPSHSSDELFEGDADITPACATAQPPAPVSGAVPVPFGNIGISHTEHGSLIYWDNETNKQLDDAALELRGLYRNRPVFKERPAGPDRSASKKSSFAAVVTNGQNKPEPPARPRYDPDYATPSPNPVGNWSVYPILLEPGSPVYKYLFGTIAPTGVINDLVNAYMESAFARVNAFLSKSIHLCISALLEQGYNNFVKTVNRFPSLSHILAPLRLCAFAVVTDDAIVSTEEVRPQPHRSTQVNSRSITTRVAWHVGLVHHDGQVKPFNFFRKTLMRIRDGYVSNELVALYRPRLNGLMSEATAMATLSPMGSCATVMWNANFENIIEDTSILLLAQIAKSGPLNPLSRSSSTTTANLLTSSRNRLSAVPTVSTPRVDSGVATSQRPSAGPSHSPPTTEFAASSDSTPAQTISEPPFAGMLSGLPFVETVNLIMNWLNSASSSTIEFLKFLIQSILDKFSANPSGSIPDPIPRPSSDGFDDLSTLETLSATFGPSPVINPATAAASLRTNSTSPPAANPRKTRGQSPVAPTKHSPPTVGSSTPSSTKFSPKNTSSSTSQMASDANLSATTFRDAGTASKATSRPLSPAWEETSKRSSKSRSTRTSSGSAKGRPTSSTPSDGSLLPRSTITDASRFQHLPVDVVETLTHHSVTPLSTSLSIGTSPLNQAMPLPSSAGSLKETTILSVIPRDNLTSTSTHALASLSKPLDTTTAARDSFAVSGSYPTAIDYSRTPSTGCWISGTCHRLMHVPACTLHTSCTERRHLATCIYMVPISRFLDPYVCVSCEKLQISKYGALSYDELRRRLKGVAAELMAETSAVYLHIKEHYKPLILAYENGLCGPECVMPTGTPFLCLKSGKAWPAIAALSSSVQDTLVDGGMSNCSTTSTDSESATSGSDEAPP